MGKIYLVSLESVPSRYTSQWKEHLPKIIAEKTGKEVIDIEGGADSIEATPGAFLNFSSTNIFKSNQAIEIAKLFESNTINDGDVFLFCDAWNPVIIQTRYMIDLLGVNAKIHSIWHAGSYDPADLLGQKITNKKWSYNFERAVFFASDINYFATEFHIDLMTGKLDIERHKHTERIVRTGFPMECVHSEYVKPNQIKERIVIFPHRTSPEKNIDLFREIKRRSEESDLGFRCIICQDNKLTKDEYYELMGRSMLMFSASLQETLGLSALDALASGTDIMVPDRLSYREMYTDRVKYKEPVFIDGYIIIIQNMLDKFDPQMVKKEYDHVREKYFVGDIMYQSLKTV